MLKLIVQLLTLLNSLIMIIRARQKEIQVEKLEENPGEWFDGHFNGVSRDDIDSSTTDQAASAEHNNSERRDVP